MAFQVSPGVNVTEKDLTNLVPSVATTTGAFCGYFNWGPAEQIVQIDSERSLIETFGYPNNKNAEYWFTAANFLSYGNDLRVVRKTTATAANSIVRGLWEQGSSTVYNLSDGLTGGTSGVFIRNADDYYDGIPVSGVSGLAGPDENSLGIASTGFVPFVAKYPGGLANSISVSISDLPQEVEYGGITTQSGSGVTFVTSNNETVLAGVLEVAGVSTSIAGKGGLDEGTIVETIPLDFVGQVARGDLIRLSGTNSLYTVVGFSGGTASDASATVNVDVASEANHYNESTVYTHVYVVPELLPEDVGSGITGTILWRYNGNFDRFPDTSTQAETYGLRNDEVQIAVIDRTGLLSGAPGTVLETFTASKARDAKRFDGTSNYYVNVINQNSKYIWWGDHPAGEFVNEDGVYGGTTSGRSWGDDFEQIRTGDGDSGQGTKFNRLIRNFYGDMIAGVDGQTAELFSGANNDRLYTGGYELFEDAETVDVALILGGPSESTLSKKLVELAEKRKDAVTFLSPIRTACVNNNTPNIKVSEVVNYYNNILNKSSSYGFFDSGWKYQYDRYNDVYRWIPLNGDIAGLTARTEFNTDAWFSPAGFNRGQINNVVKLSYNPSKSLRDTLYKNNINPVVSFPGEGTILYGDKTMQRKASAFDRLNVRRLFIVLEKAIATAAKFFLFEFNDQFTRAQFVSTVEPFLREVRGRRGITDFRIVCDETNNTGDVIDRNEFVADIFIKPARSINYIQLNFVAVRTDVNFEEVLGA